MVVLNDYYFREEERRELRHVLFVIDYPQYELAKFYNEYMRTYYKSKYDKPYSGGSKTFVPCLKININLTNIIAIN